MPQIIDVQNVYCRILQSAIPGNICEDEQGQKSCHGCDAITRRCEKCKKNQSENPQTGLCTSCLMAAINAGYCEECRKRPAKNGSEGTLCSYCYAKQVKAGELEPSVRGPQCQKTDISVDAILDKAETLLVDGFVPGAAQKTDQNTAGNPRQSDPNLPMRIVEHVAVHYGTTKNAILSPRKHAALVFPRFVCMFLLRETGLSLPVIGAILDRNHTSVMHGCRTIQQQLGKNSELRDDLDALRKALGITEVMLPPILEEFVPPVEKHKAEPEVLVPINADLANNENVHCDKIIARVSKHFNIPTEELLGRKRGNNMSLPRQILAYFLLEAGYTMSSVADMIGNRAEMSVWQAVRRFVKHVMLEENVSRTINDIRCEILDQNPITQEVKPMVAPNRDAEPQPQMNQLKRGPGRKGKLGKPGFNPETVLSAVMTFYGLDRNIFFGRATNREHIKPRRMFMYLLSEVGDMGASAIGRYISQSQPNVFLSTKAFKKQIETDTALKGEVMMIRRHLSAGTPVTSDHPATAQPEMKPPPPNRAPQTVILRKQEPPTVPQPSETKTPPLALPTPRFTPEDYKKAVARRYGHKVETLNTPENMEASLPKQVLVFLLRDSGLTFGAIASFMRCNVTAAFMVHQAVEKRRKENPNLQLSIDTIKQSLSALPDVADENADHENELMKTEEVPLVTTSDGHLKNMRQELEHAPHFKNWWLKAGLLESRRALNALRVLPRIQPGKEAPAPLPVFLQSGVSQDEWVWLLAQICAEYVTYNGLKLGFVAYYAEAIPLPAETLQAYLTDDRIVQLTGKRSKQGTPGAHLIVCDTKEEAAYLRLGLHEMPDRPFSFL